jgi:hypothetical protein
VGDPKLAMAICEAALARGVFAQAIRPPTVPPMTSRLRLAVMATHREEELRAAARALATVARAAGFDPRTRVMPARPTPEPEHSHAPEPQRRLAPEPERQPAAASSRHDRPRVFDFEAPERVRRAA